MAEILVKQKPDTISWEELAQCQHKAHASNIVAGVKMQCSDYSADQLKKEAEKGTTLVAIDSHNNMMGMLTFIYKNENQWWHKGMAAFVCYVAVNPECKGKGVYRALSKKAESLILSKGVCVEYLHTHVDNSVARKAYEKDGYRNVRFLPGSGTDYYSVEMAKWLNTKGKSEWLCAVLFTLYQVIVKSLYKPGKRRRF